MTDFIGLPKAEVHIHVEGCFETDDVIRNCEEAGIPLRRPREKLFEAHDLRSFLEMLDWIFAARSARRSSWQTPPTSSPSAWREAGFATPTSSSIRPTGRTGVATLRG